MKSVILPDNNLVLHVNVKYKQSIKAGRPRWDGEKKERLGSGEDENEYMPYP